MKPNFTPICMIMLCIVIAFSPITSLAQYNPGLPAAFGIDGDVLSGQAQNIAGNSSDGSFDWFRKPGTGSNIGYGIIDTTGTYVYNAPIASGQNISFSRGMAYSRYSAVNGFLLLDARYARDDFGFSDDPIKGDHTTFVSGMKNGDNPSAWLTETVGRSVQNKADIIDTYVHMRREGTVINNTNPSPLILALAVNTVGNTGTRYVDFELFKERVQFNPQTGVISNSGPAATGGHTIWQFNANGTLKDLGDMSVSFSFGTSGVTEIALYIWIPQSVFNSVIPSGFNFVPGEFYGSTFGYAKIVPKPANPFRTWGSVSSGSTNAPFWGSNSKTIGASGSNYYASQYAAGDFGEVAIDFTSLGIDPALASEGNPCVPPFTRVMAKSRSSVSFTSSLQDFTGPYEFLDAPQAPAQIAAPGNLRCNNPTVTLSPAVNVSGASYIWSTTDGNIESNPNAATITVNKAGKYYLTAAIVAGCPTRTDSTTVMADYFKPVASAIVQGTLNPSDPSSYVTILGGDIALSNVPANFGGSTGLTWKWTGPNGFTFSQRVTSTNLPGTYMLELTESRNGCKDTAYAPVAMGAVLMVKYLSFDAVATEKSVLLKWVTAEEINNSHFEVERSFDSRSFKSVGLVMDGFPSLGTGKSYQFTDYSAELQGRTIVYYRLNQIDIDGKSTLSKVIAVKLQPKHNVSMEVSPNPVAERVTVRFTAVENGRAEIRITSAAGLKVFSRQTKINKGYNNIQVDELGKLNPGIYITQLLLNGVVVDHQKILKN